MTAINLAAIFYAIYKKYVEADLSQFILVLLNLNLAFKIKTKE